MVGLTHLQRAISLALLTTLLLSVSAYAQCTDTDPGNDIYMKGTVTLADGTVYTDGCPTSAPRFCGDDGCPRPEPEKVMEFFCDDGTATGDDVSCSGTGVCARQVTCPSIGVCTDGACVPGEPYCTDTDGGRDYTKKGTVTSSSPLPNSPPNTDSCSYGSPGGDRLYEYYCEGVAAPAGGGGTDNRMVHDSHAAAAGYVDAIWVEEYVCPVRCYDGACVDTTCPALVEPTCPSGTSPRQITDSSGCRPYKCVSTGTLCSDSDGGRIYAEKGTVSWEGRSYTDSCRSDSELSEYYCDGAIMRPEVHTCSGGCKDGACLGPEDTVKETPIRPIKENTAAGAAKEEQPKGIGGLFVRLFSWFRKVFG